MTTMPVLKIDALTAGYGRTTVLRDVSLEVAPGRIAALVGPNGAGKTTLLRAIAGANRVRSGSVAVEGRDVTSAAAHRRSRAGICLIPEGRGIFRRLTVKENLQLHLPPGERSASIEPALEAFPDLRDRIGQVAGTMSGGQQQMLALGRCFLSRPKIVLLDEVSMGLAPQVIDTIFDALAALAADGVAMVVVEQYVSRALELADDVHLLTGGSLAFSGRPTDLDAETVLAGYLGASRNTNLEGEQ